MTNTQIVELARRLDAIEGRMDAMETKIQPLVEMHTYIRQTRAVVVYVLPILTFAAVLIGWLR